VAKLRSFLARSKAWNFCYESHLRDGFSQVYIPDLGLHPDLKKKTLDCLGVPEMEEEASGVRGGFGNSACSLKPAAMLPCMKSTLFPSVGTKGCREENKTKKGVFLGGTMSVPTKRVQGQVPNSPDSRLKSRLYQDRHSTSLSVTTWPGQHCQRRVGLVQTRIGQISKALADGWTLLESHNLMAFPYKGVCCTVAYSTDCTQRY
jgi:hypothetical protein